MRNPPVGLYRTLKFEICNPKITRLITGYVLIIGDWSRDWTDFSPQQWLPSFDLRQIIMFA